MRQNPPRHPPCDDASSQRFDGVMPDAILVDLDAEAGGARHDHAAVLDGKRFGQEVALEEIAAAQSSCSGGVKDDSPAGAGSRAGAAEASPADLERELLLIGASPTSESIVSCCMS